MWERRLKNGTVLRVVGCSSAQRPATLSCVWLCVGQLPDETNISEEELAIDHRIGDIRNWRLPLTCDSTEGDTESGNFDSTQLYPTCNTRQAAGMFGEQQDTLAVHLGLTHGRMQPRERQGPEMSN